MTIRKDNELLTRINEEYTREAFIKKNNTIDLFTLTLVIWYIVLVEIVYYSNL